MTGERLAVLVHHGQEARTAIAIATAAGHEVELLLPVGLLGPAFAKALEDELGRPVVAYCDDRPGLALEALRVGLRRLVLEPATAAGAIAWQRLDDIARQQGATLANALPDPLFRPAANGRYFVPAGLGAGDAPVP